MVTEAYVWVELAPYLSAFEFLTSMVCDRNLSLLNRLVREGYLRARTLSQDTLFFQVAWEFPGQLEFYFLSLTY